MPLKPCLTCGRLSRGSYCAAHEPVAWRLRPSPSSRDRPSPSFREGWTSDDPYSPSQVSFRYAVRKIAARTAFITVTADEKRRTFVRRVNWVL